MQGCHFNIFNEFEAQDIANESPDSQLSRGEKQWRISFCKVRLWTILCKHPKNCVNFIKIFCNKEIFNSIHKKLTSPHLGIGSSSKTCITFLSFKILPNSFFPLKEEYQSFQMNYNWLTRVARCRKELRKIGEPTAPRTLYYRMLK